MPFDHQQVMGAKRGSGNLSRCCADRFDLVQEQVATVHIRNTQVGRLDWQLLASARDLKPSLDVRELAYRKERPFH